MKKIACDFRESPAKMSMEMRFADMEERAKQMIQPKTRTQINQRVGVAAADKVITFSTRGLIQILSFNSVRSF